MSAHGKQVEDIINKGGFGKLVRLPNNCRDTHYYIENDDTDNVLPIKVNIACDNKKRGRKFSSLELPFTCLMLLWVPEESESRFALVRPGDVNVNGATMNAIKAHNSTKVYNKNDLVENLHQAYKECTVLFDLAALTEITKRAKITREQWKSLESPYETESKSLRELSDVIGTQFHITLPSLKADAYFGLEGHDNVMPLQVKSSNRNKRNFFQFNSCAGYKMILLCRPLQHKSIGTLVIPGDLAKPSIHYSETSPTYSPFAIDDSQLPTFLSSLFLSVSKNEQTFTWPSGKEVSISALKLQTIDEINQDTWKTFQTEHRNQRLREKLLPSLRFYEPEVHNTTVDKLVDGFRVQDKVGEKTTGEAYNVTIKKCAGHPKGKRTYQPYHEEDFEILWVFVPGDRYQFIIPVYELVNKGKLQTTTAKGSKNLMIHLKNSSSGRGDQWTREFCFDTQDDDFQDQVKHHLEKIKTRIEIE